MAHEVAGVMRVSATSRAAEDAGGILPDMPLADARARLPGLRVVSVDQSADDIALATIADWCGRWTPWVSLDAASGREISDGRGLWLDVTGCAHLFGGEAQLVEDLIARLRQFGYEARAAMADTPGAAWAAAHYGDDEALAQVVPAGHSRAMLADLPLAALRLAPDDVEGLERLGLRRVGALYGIPRGALVRRFGAASSQRLDQALGFASEPLSPRRPATRFRVQRLFAEPLGDGAALIAVASALFTDLEALLTAADKGARRIELVFYRVDGSTVRIAAGTSAPARQAAHFIRLLEEQITAVDCEFGIDVVAAGAPLVELMPAHQISLSSGAGEAGVFAATPAGDVNSSKGEVLARLLDRLGGRFGLENVTRLDARESHVPERAQVSVPPLVPPAPWQRPASGGLRRPVRLLPRPESVEAVAMAPDAPPVMFRWRHVTHRIVRADGPERIAAEWWRRADTAREDAARDYYRVEDERGRRFWLFRDTPFRPGMAPGWWLHGMFA